MIRTLADPTKRAPRLATALEVVRVVFTLSKIRMTPEWKISLSLSRAWNPLMIRMPPSASVRRPVTSARIRPRSRKAGRRVLKARAETQLKAASGTMASSVITTSMRIRKTSATTAVTEPPTSCTSPVPTRFRTPSTSSMIRETSSPLFALSKTRTGSSRTCFCTWVRSWAMRFWASTLRSMVRE
jgi:hypothetical protein